MFSELNFNDYSDTSTMAFGISGKVNNNTKDTIYFISTINYYTSNYNLIASSHEKKSCKPGEIDFNKMSNLDLLKDKNTSDIYYYRLSIEQIDKDMIDVYDIDIVVNEDNSFNITENIIAFFNIPKHGILKKNTFKK